MSRLTPIVLAISMALACSGGGGNVTVDGTLNGHAFHAADAVATNATVLIEDLPVNLGLLTIASSSALCANANANREAKNTQYLLMAFGDVNPTTAQISPPTAPGVYVVGQPSTLGASAYYTQTDASCHEISGAPERGGSGTITLSSVNNGSYSGSFDLRMGGGSSPDHITGSFSAPNCPASAVFADAHRATTCF